MLLVERSVPQGILHKTPKEVRSTLQMRGT